MILIISRVFLVSVLASVTFADTNDFLCEQLTENRWQSYIRLGQDPSFNEKESQRFRKSLDACLNKFNLPETCLENFDKFDNNRKAITRIDHSNQFIESDSEYISKRARFFKLPVEFQGGLPSNWKEIVEQKGWKRLEYTSGAIGNPPGLAFNRIVVLREDVNDGEFDQWIQFTVEGKYESTGKHAVGLDGREGFEYLFSSQRPEPKSVVKGRLIDIIAVQKKGLTTRGLEPLEKNKLNFIEYWRDEEGRNPKILNKQTACYNCHISGMRTIIPAPGTRTFTGDGYDLSYFNSKIQTLTRPPVADMGGAIELEAYGPPAGKLQGCTGCHSGYMQGVINSGHFFPKGQQQLYYKMAQALHMPPEESGILSKEDSLRFKPVFEILRKLDELEDNKKVDIYAPNMKHVWKIIEGQVRTSEVGVTSYSYEGLIRKHFPDEDLDDIIPLLREYQKIAHDTFQRMKKDYKSQLLEWLEGGEECSTPIRKFIDIRKKEKELEDLIRSSKSRLPL